MKAFSVVLSAFAVLLVLYMLATSSISTALQPDGADGQLPADCAGTRFDPVGFTARVLQRDAADVQQMWQTVDGAEQLLAELPNLSVPDCISGPLSVARRELELRIVKQKVDLGPAVPVDYVVWRKTPHAEPFRTQLGGVPWRPRSRPWPDPHPQYGEYVFAVQYDISESHDLLPNVFLESRPAGAEVLLLFFADDEADAIADGIHFEWSPHQIDDPCQPADVPKPKFHIEPRAGLLFRAMEYPNNLEHTEDCPPGLPPFQSQMDGTRIGTATNWIQNDATDTGRPTKLVVTLGSFGPYKEWPYPDQREPVPGNTYVNRFCGHHISFGDGGTIYVLHEPGKPLFYYSDCY